MGVLISLCTTVEIPSVKINNILYPQKVDDCDTHIPKVWQLQLSFYLVLSFLIYKYEFSLMHVVGITYSRNLTKTYLLQWIDALTEDQ